MNLAIILRITNPFLYKIKELLLAQDLLFDSLIANYNR